MAATDYEIVNGWFNPYLVKKKKTKSNNHAKTNSTN